MSSSLSRNFKSPAALACFLLTVLLGVGLDQWSKQEAFDKLCGGVVTAPDGTVQAVDVKTISFIPGLLDFTVTTNKGAVFGIGQGQRTLFIAVSAAAVVFICYLFAASGKQRLYQIILGMLLAGVIGNLYDRLQLHYVRDMIHALPRWPGLFPYIFNVADSLLCVGVGLMIIHSLFHRAEQPEKDAHSSTEVAEPT